MMLKSVPFVPDTFLPVETLDKRTKLPFGWHFFMLHGNRVRREAGERMIELAESGQIVVPEHDYRVLKEWQDQPYSF